MKSSRVSPHPGISKIRFHMVVSESAGSTKTQVDISSNESAYGPNPSAIVAAAKAARNMERYPTNASRLLANQIANRFRLDPDGVVCGHGSDDLLLRLAQAFLQAGDELICSINGYQRIPNFAHTANATPVKASDRQFTADIDAILSCVSARTRMVVIANPDNPTGTHLSGAQVRRLRRNLPSNILLVLDSAYFEYADEGEIENPKLLIEAFDNVVMTRTFSKIFGLAGLRLGWLYATPPIAAAVQKIGMTFPISNIAYEAGIASLEDMNFVDRIRNQNAEVRNRFVSRMKELGLTAVPSQTNFVLIRFAESGISADNAYKCLQSRGIIARRFPADAFDNYIRFTIGLEQEMDMTFDVLQEYCDQLRGH